VLNNILGTRAKLRLKMFVDHIVNETYTFYLHFIDSNTLSLVVSI